VDEALSGLGFAREEWRRAPAELSGGQQTRGALARLVIGDPDLLLLDEPTNHLDLDALEWLEEHLRRRAGALLLASHDRAFLAAAREERIGIVGPNGAGKTTLLRTIAGELPPLDGVLSFGNAVQIGYLAQLRESAIPGTTVLDALLAAMPVTAGEARSYLARFLFRADDVLKEVRSLSGGERSRLELALLGIMPANLLLLDEPTNHLD